MITILTHHTNPLKKEFWKWVGQRVLKKYSGPQAVRDSLCRGLVSLAIPFEVNPTYVHSDTVVVLSGVKALSKAIRLKRTGKITKLVAGPNLVVTPDEYGGIIQDPAIDYVLVPSKWVADFYAETAPQLTPRLHIWAAGVVTANASTRDAQPIVYDKCYDANTTKNVLDQLTKLGYTPHHLTYGSFQHHDFLTLLRTAPFLVYLSKSESQGLALQEAWAHDVPTFVICSTLWKYKDVSFKAPQINAPYLTDELGQIFSDPRELAALAEQAQSFHPKKYCDLKLSDSASTRVLLSILGKNSQNFKV